MKSLVNKLLTWILIFLMIPQTCAVNVPSKTVTKKHLLEAAGTVATVTLGTVLLYFVGDKISYEYHKSENGVDMRYLTERGYNNKNVSVTDLKESDDKLYYLKNKWCRTRKGCSNYYRNTVPVVFAHTFPKVADDSSLTNYDIFQGNEYKYSPEWEQEVRKSFKRYGVLKYFDDMVREALYRGGVEIEDKNIPFWRLECALLPLYLSQAPGEEYFTLYYHTLDFSDPCMPYERFDYERWAKDVFHRDFKTVLNKHREIFKKYGAKVDGLTVWGWNLTNCNISAAEQEIEQWRKECCLSNT